jgi:phosphoserine phosphatase
VAHQDLADKSEEEVQVRLSGGSTVLDFRQTLTDIVRLIDPNRKKAGMAKMQQKRAEKNRRGDWLSALGRLVRHDPGRGEHPVSRWLEQGAVDLGCL